MAELNPASFRDLVTRLFREPVTQDALFELPRRRWYLPVADSPDLTVPFHDQRAGNPSGPAAGPHTQMAQNLLLSYVAGGRILELKTVQVNDRLTIGRPCIDMTNVGYNIEWSQELLVADSLREYVAGAMLIDMFRRNRGYTGGLLDGTAGEIIYDISVGYDLAGIKSDKVRGFLDGMRNAGEIVEQLRGEIPREFQSARDGDYLTHLSNSITLSTFHGCPADEIESICEFLVGECDFDVIVGMNPPTLGKERLEHLLYDVMGYRELTVNPSAYGAVVPFKESVQLCEHLTRFAKSRHRRMGFKFSNTLEVTNHREFFTPDNKIQYLSGQPLHVITMTLTDEFRRAVGPDVPISFSAGIDKANFHHAVACGFVPVTSSTDLLRVGGYGRLPAYMETLAREMAKVSAKTIDEFMLNRFGQAEEARRRALTDRGASGNEKDIQDATIRWAGLLNTTIVAEMARNDGRYYAEQNRVIPKRIDSHLKTFDCITCDKCLPVCPNAANFTYPSPIVTFDYSDYVVKPDGKFQADGNRRFEIIKAMQIACYADFCNECGNCDTFCPEYGGPYIEKPTFFGSIDTLSKAAPRDGFVVGRTSSSTWIIGRIKGATYQLEYLTNDAERSRSDNGNINHGWSEFAGGNYRLNDGVVTTVFDGASHQLISVSVSNALTTTHRIDMWAYHTLRFLLHGVLTETRTNQVNAIPVDITR